MADHSRYQQGVIRRAYEHKDTIALQKLSEIVSDLYLAEGASAVRLWKSAATALAKLSEDEKRIAKVVASKDLQGLARLVTELSAGARAAKPESEDSPVIGESPAEANAAVRPSSSISPTPPDSIRPAPPASPGPSAAPTPEQLKSALKMFRKRMKLKRLDDESKLGRNPLSSGKKSATVAIMAPREFPPAVWEELARQGKLKHAGGSFYELVE